MKEKHWCKRILSFCRWNTRVYEEHRFM